MSTDAVKKALVEFQRLARKTPSQDLTSCSMYSTPVGIVYLDAEQDAAMTNASEALEADLRFEHMNDPKRAVRNLLDLVVSDREQDHVPGFMEENAIEPEDWEVFIPIEHLVVAEPREVYGITLLPVDDPRVPAASPGFQLTKPVGSVALVVVRATDGGKLAERARSKVGRSLRLLRVALREPGWLHARQLRFQLSPQYALDARRTGWRRPPEGAYEVELADPLMEVVEDSLIGDLAAEPATDLYKKADLATKWIERAALTGDRLEALLFLFFALVSPLIEIRVFRSPKFALSPSSG